MPVGDRVVSSYLWGVRAAEPQDMQVVDKETGRALAVVDRDMVRIVVDDAIGRYVATRRARIPAFVDRNFSFRGAARLHRRAAGWDVLRAPVNLALALPHVLIKLGALGSRAAGANGMANRLDRTNLFFASDVSREVEWRVFTELLELPYAQEGRSFHRDALAEEIFSDPRVSAAMRETLEAIGRRADDPRFAGWLADAMTTYTSSRVAAGDLANAMIAAGVGALTFKQLTPGAISLGPILAQAMVHQAAVASFPLGAGIGGLWYGVVPTAATAGFVVGVTGGLLAIASVLTAFSGVLTDPVQKRLGLHQRRLNLMVDSLDAELTGLGDSRYAVRDHYAARVFDIVDLLRAAYSVAR